MTTLETSRLRLRPWRFGDRRPFAALCADPEVMKYFPAPLSTEESARLVARFSAGIEERGWGFWVVERREDHHFIGMVGLNPTEDDLPFARQVEVGWRLARQFWGQGYATEAARACVDFAFTVLKEPSLVAFTTVTNLPSQAVMSRLGMTPGGFFDHPRLPKAHPLRPHIWFGLTNPSL